MGWLSYTIHTSPKKEMDRIYGDFKANTFEVTENGKTFQRTSQMIKSFLYGNEYYGAIKIIDHLPDGDKEWVTAAVDKIWYSPRSYKTDNFGYKQMGEFMGPYLDHCPKTILKLLTPTENKYAIEWRKRQWNRILKIEALNKLPMQTKIMIVVPFDSLRREKGEEVVLTKCQGWRRTMWYDGIYKWPIDLIPDNYKIINKGGK